MNSSVSMLTASFDKSGKIVNGEEKLSFSEKLFNNALNTTSTLSATRVFNHGGTQQYGMIAVNSFGQTLVQDSVGIAMNWMSDGAKGINDKNDELQTAQNATDRMLADSGAVMRDWELSPDEQLLLATMNPGSIEDREALAALIKSKPHALVSSNSYLEKSVTADAAEGKVTEDVLKANGLHRLNDKATIEKQLGKDVDLKYYDESKGGFYDKDSGYFAALYYDSNNDKYILANRGTDQILGDTLKASVPEFMGEQAQQFEIAKNIAQSLKRVDNINLEFTGHSLGGSLAAVQALSTGNQATTFNSKGLSSASVSQYSAKGVTAKNVITGFVVQGELLNTAQDNAVSKLLFGAIATPLHNTKEVFESALGKNSDPSFGLKTFSSSVGRRFDLSAIHAQSGNELNGLQQLNPFTKYQNHGIDAMLRSMDYAERSLMQKVTP